MAMNAICAGEIFFYFERGVRPMGDQLLIVYDPGRVKRKLFMFKS